MAERVVGIVDHTAQGGLCGFIDARIPLIAPKRGLAARRQQPAE